MTRNAAHSERAPEARGGALLALILALALWAAPAAAQPAASIAGAWAIETDPFPLNSAQCTITGDALVAPEGAAFSVRLRTHERCSNGAAWRSVQTCTATQSAAAVQVECAIVSVYPANYAPDDFTLTQRGANLMEGQLISHRVIQARWRRAAGDLIS